MVFMVLARSRRAVYTDFTCWVSMVFMILGLKDQFSGGGQKTAKVMFMHAGFAMLETGCCRAKNASNVLMKNLGCC